MGVKDILKCFSDGPAIGMICRMILSSLPTVMAKDDREAGSLGRWDWAVIPGGLLPMKMTFSRRADSKA